MIISSLSCHSIMQTFDSCNLIQDEPLEDQPHQVPSLQGSCFIEHPERVITVKPDTREKLQETSLTCAFNPFEFSVTPLIRIMSTAFSRAQSIQIYGATFGRNEANTYSFPDQTKVSSQHARIIFSDGCFVLQDMGSKGGTYLRIRQNFEVHPSMQFYIGNRFAFRTLSVDARQGSINVVYERAGLPVEFMIKMRPGEVWRVGRDQMRNQSSFAKSAQSTTYYIISCHSLLSDKHFELTYAGNARGELQFLMHDLDTTHGTWLRMGEKQIVSPMFKLSNKSCFTMSFQIECTVLDVKDDN